VSDHECSKCSSTSYPDDPCACEHQRRREEELRNENCALRRRVDRLQRACEFFEEQLSGQRQTIERQHKAIGALGKSYNKLRSSMSKLEFVQVKAKVESKYMFQEGPGGYVVNKRAAGIMDGDPFLVGSEDPELKQRLHEEFNEGKHDTRTLQEKIEDAKEGGDGVEG